jgi:hypothetical protein
MKSSFVLTVESFSFRAVPVPARFSEAGVSAHARLPSPTNATLVTVARSTKLRLDFRQWGPVFIVRLLSEADVRVTEVAGEKRVTAGL